MDSISSFSCSLMIIQHAYDQQARQDLKSFDMSSTLINLCFPCLCMHVCVQGLIITPGTGTSYRLIHDLYATKAQKQHLNSDFSAMSVYCVWLCLKCSILHHLSQWDISWGGPVGCLYASSPLCCLHVGEEGRKAKRRTPLSLYEPGIPGKIEAWKGKENWTVLWMWIIAHQ